MKTLHLLANLHVTTLDFLDKTKPPVPNPEPTEPPGKIADNISMILAWGLWLLTAVCVAGIFAAAASMAIARHRGDTPHLSRLGWVLGACVLAGSASAIVAAFLS